MGGEEVDTSEYEQKITDLENMLESQNQMFAQRDSTIENLEEEVSEILEMIQYNQELIANVENYRDSLLIQLENSNNSREELILLLESSNYTIDYLENRMLMQTH